MDNTINEKRLKRKDCAEYVARKMTNILFSLKILYLHNHPLFLANAILKYHILTYVLTFFKKEVILIIFHTH